MAWFKISKSNMKPKNQLLWNVCPPVKSEETPKPVFKNSKKMLWQMVPPSLKESCPNMYITKVLNYNINPSLN